MEHTKLKKNVVDFNIFKNRILLKETFWKFENTRLQNYQYIISSRIQDYRFTIILNNGEYKITELSVYHGVFKITELSLYLNHGEYKNTDSPVNYFKRIQNYIILKSCN